MKQRQASSVLATLFCMVAFLNVIPLQRVVSATPSGSRHAQESLLALSEDSASWSDPLQLSESALNAANPVVVIDSVRDTLHLAWEEGGSIRYTYRDASGWHFDPNPIPGDSPALAIDPDGVAHLVYVEPEGEIRHTLRGPQGWKPPSNVSRTSGQSIHPDLAITVDHGIHAVWTEQLGEDYDIYHAQSVDNGLSWYAMQPVPQASGYAVSLAATTGGRLRAAWQGRATGSNGLMHIYSADYDGALWTQPVTVSLGLDGEARDPDLETDSVGHAHLVWEQDAQNGGSSIYYAQNFARAWTAPMLVSPQGDEARYPCLAVGAATGMHVAWRSEQTLLHRRQNQGNWQQPEPVTTGQGDIRQAALAAGSDGVIYAAWAARDDTKVWSVFFSERSPYKVLTPTTSPTSSLTPSAAATPDGSATPTRPVGSRNLVPSVLLGRPSPSRLSNLADVPGGVSPQTQPTWSTPVDISVSGRNSHDVALAVGLDGTVFAVWEEDYSGSPVLFSSRLQNGSWTSPVDWYAGESPSLAVGPDGIIHMVYANEFRKNYDIYYTTWLTETNRWAEPVNVSNTTGRSVQPGLAIQSDGRPVVVWSEKLDVQTSIYFARRNGGFWETYPLNASSAGEAPDVAVERSGRIWAAWQVLEEERINIYAIYGDGESWDFAQEISDGTGVGAVGVDLVGVSSLGAFAVWQGGQTTGSQVYYTHNLPGVSYWEAATDVSQSAGSASSPALSVDGAGNMHLVWTEGNEVRYRRGAAGEQTWSSTSSIVSQVPGLGSAALAAASGSQVHVAWQKAMSADQHDIYYSAASAPAPTATPTLTPSRTPTLTRTPTPTPTFPPLPRRLGLPIIIKP